MKFSLSSSNFSVAIPMKFFRRFAIVIRFREHVIKTMETALGVFFAVYSRFLATIESKTLHTYFLQFLVYNIRSVAF